MAQKVLYMLTDDLDGSPAEETVAFALDGSSYEIDLSGKNATALRKGLDKFVAGARKVPRPTGDNRGRSLSARSPRRAEAEPKAVRTWAHEHGIPISRRGPIAAEIIEQYRAAGGA